MTDRNDLPPESWPDELDELVSAYLDGEATPDEVARVESDEGLRARVAVFTAVRDRVAAPAPAPQGALDGAIGAALAAFDAGGNGDADTRDPASGTAAVVVAHRASSRSRLYRFAPVLAAVAGLVVVVGLVSVISRANSGDDAATSSAELATASTADNALSDAAEASLGAPANQAEAGAGAGRFAEPTDLGSFENADEVLEAVVATSEVDRPTTVAAAPASSTTTRYDVAPTTQPTTTTPASKAGEDAAAACPVGPAIATATVAGEPVVLVEVTDADGAKIQVLRASDCRLLADAPR